MSRKLLGSLLLALHTSMALAQTKPTPPSPPNDNWQTVFFESPATALPLLTAAAIRHSAQLKAMELDKAINEQDLRITKKNILGSFALGSNLTYGNLAGVSAANGNGVLFPTNNSFRHSTGVNFSLPLDNIVSRGNQIKRQELTNQRAEVLRQEQENQLRQQLIPLYQNVLLAKRMLTLRQESAVTAQTSFKLAERQFRQGQLPLTEFSEATNHSTEAAVSEAAARSQYDTAFMVLEEVVGAKISSLMTTR